MSLSSYLKFLENNGMLILGPLQIQQCPTLYQSVSTAQQVLKKNSCDDLEDFMAFFLNCQH